MKIVIIPTYNEKNNIERIISAVFNQKIKNLAILVVDDSSPDGTGKIVQKLQKKFKNLHLLTNKEKKGLGKAYINGMNYAIDKLNAKILIEMDSDFSHDPKVLSKLINETKKFDLVIGSRYIKGGTIPSNWALHRKMVSYFGNIVFSITLGNFKVRDWTTGYRAIKKEVFEKIKPELNDDMFQGYTFQAGFLYKTLKYNFKVKEIPINFIDRKHDKSKFLGINYIINNLKFIFKTWFSK